MPYTNDPGERVLCYPSGHRWAWASIITVMIPDAAGVMRSAFGGGTVEETIQANAEYTGARLLTWDDFRAGAIAEQAKVPAIWRPTTRAKFHEMLEVLPPIAWRGGAFLVGEPCDHDVATGRHRYEAYREQEAIHGHGPAFWFVSSRPVTVAELDANRSTPAGQVWRKEGVTE